ncbi:MAG: nucleotidyltransferase domain-containing protein [Oculatellaceae cyanobacterium bins.114]|nr:nucleotidyltransferase domain-containing protein [Oculatellaceae cyanobacterium bins.114]
MLPISSEQMAAYRASALKRYQDQQEHLRDRHQLGLAVARQAADLLKQNFKARKVVLFGSMLSFDLIHERSDVDLAVWGLAPQDYYRAVGCLLALQPGILIDLVEVESAPTRLLTEIEASGLVL